MALFRNKISMEKAEKANEKEGMKEGRKEKQAATRTTPTETLATYPQTGQGKKNEEPTRCRPGTRTPSPAEEQTRQRPALGPGVSQGCPTMRDQPAGGDPTTGQKSPL